MIRAATEIRMSYSSARRAALAATVMLAVMGLASAARAETCSIAFTVIKAGFGIGGQGGSGAVRCGGRSYPLSIGGLSYGFMIGASETRFRGSATFRGSPYNVAGVYGAGSVGGAVGRGAQAMALVNEKGTTLQLIGVQRGLQINADLNGLAITMR
jgi:lipid-binding SYLF domain-containing protein